MDSRTRSSLPGVTASPALTAMLMTVPVSGARTATPSPLVADARLPSAGGIPAMAATPFDCLLLRRCIPANAVTSQDTWIVT